MRRESSSGAETRGEKLLCGVAAVLFPTSILCYFCAQNINEFVEVWLIYFMLGALVVLAALAYCVALLIFRRGFLALGFCTVCWIGCYLESLLFSLFDCISLSYVCKLVCVSLIVLAAAALAVFLLRRMKQDVRRSVAFFSAFLVLILLFNLLPVVQAGFSAKASRNTEEQLYQADFYVDAAKTDAPNVYWFHPDGMASVDMVEKYFHDDQSEFLSALAARGFSVNPSAHFKEALGTTLAISVLTSPYAYDTWISGCDVATMLTRSNYEFHDKLRDVRRHNEMITAFGKNGYALSVISVGSDVYYPPLFEGAFYNIDNDRDEVDTCSEEDLDKWMLLQSVRTNMGNISRFLKEIFGKLYQMIFLTPPSQWNEKLMTPTISVGASQPFSAKMPEEQLRQIMPTIPDYAPGSRSDSKMVRSLYDILEGEIRNRKLVIIHDFMPHGAFIFDENGALTDHGGTFEPMDYYPQHIFSGKVLVGMIDMILAVDPDAVIVIQADHGLRSAEEDFKAVFGEDADALEFRRSTMSAIRVPEKYRTGEEHYATENPLNIARYLVNSFVGENYGYLPPN